MKTALIFILSILTSAIALSQSGKIVFAHVTDTHVGSGTGADDLRNTVNELNKNDTIQFIIITGDITEFGSDEEIRLAKQILDSLNKPWHIIPGNHDSNWSESGSNTFKQVFGAETFFFRHNGYIFLGTHSGPNMRMSPGQIPRENIVWLDSVLRTVPDDAPVIFANHYPMDSSLNNWFDAIDILKKKNIQLLICGHGHSNRQFTFDGIPSVMGRSNLRAKEETGGYNIVRIENREAVYQTHRTGSDTVRTWASVALQSLKNNQTAYYRPSYAVNDLYPRVKATWTFQDDSDIGSGAAANERFVFITNTAGYAIALEKSSGKVAWRFKTNGKIYATPAVSNGIVVVASSDEYIYGIDAKTGTQKWKVKADKAVLGVPVIENNNVYIGASDGIFRAIDLSTGKLLWHTNEIKGFVVTRPFIYGNHLYFGSWGREFYCLDKMNGKIVWKWDNGHGSRMYSPAACYPVVVRDRVYIVAPDRYMTALNANTGEVIWRNNPPDKRIRESMGVSADSSLIYVKTMDGHVYGISTSADTMQAAWKSDISMGYEISPTAIIEKDGIVYIPSQSGMVAALRRENGQVAWKHKVSNALVTGILPLDKKRVVITTMDGKVSLLANQ